MVSLRSVLFKSDQFPDYEVPKLENLNDNLPYDSNLKN